MSFWEWVNTLPETVLSDNNFAEFQQIVFLAIEIGLVYLFGADGVKVQISSSINFVFRHKCREEASMCIHKFTLFSS